MPIEGSPSAERRARPRIPPKVSKALHWVVTLAVITLLVVFARKIDWAETWRTIRDASLPLLLAAAAVNLVSLVLKGVRWWIFLRPVGAPSLPLAVRATAAGAGLNNVLVAQGGDAARILFVSRATGLPGATVLATLALERLFDMLGYLLLLAVTSLLLPLPPQFDKWRYPSAGAFVVVIAGLLWLGRRAARANVAAAAVASLPRGFIARLRGHLGDFGRTVGTLATPPRFVAALTLSMGAWICQVWTFQLAAEATGMHLPFAGHVAAVLATNLGLLVRATPGNVGVFQVAYTLAATAFGATRPAAIAASVLIQILQILPVTAVGVALAPGFVFGGRRPPKVSGEP